MGAVSGGRKKKPSKGKKPGKKPSKPGVKGECDVGSPKLTAGNTKKYTDRGKCACWWDITRNDCACFKKGVGAMQCGFPMHKFCNKEGWQCEQNAIPGPDSKKGSRCQARTNQKYCASQQGDCKHIGYCDPNATCKKKANVGKFGQYWQCECNKGWSGNGIQCMDSNGTLSATPGQQVEVTLTMTAGLYDEAPVGNEFNHGAAMESLLSEMEAAGGSCSADDCEASYEVTEV